jgi:hypothetical protein
MTAERGHAGGLEPGHAAPDDHQALARSRGSQLSQLGLETDHRVLDARDRFALSQPTDASLAGANAHAHVV